MYLSSILRGRRSKAEAEPGVSGRGRGGRRRSAAPGHEYATQAERRVPAGATTQWQSPWPTTPGIATKTASGTNPLQRAPHTTHARPGGRPSRAGLPAQGPGGLVAAPVAAARARAPLSRAPPPTGGSSNVASTGGSRPTAGRTSRVVCASCAHSVAERESDAGDTGASQADGLDAAGHDGSAAGGVHSHMHSRAAGQAPGTG